MEEPLTAKTTEEVKHLFVVIRPLSHCHSLDQPATFTCCTHVSTILFAAIYQLTESFVVPALAQCSLKNSLLGHSVTVTIGNAIFFVLNNGVRLCVYTVSGNQK